MRHSLRRPASSSARVFVGLLAILILLFLTLPAQAQMPTVSYSGGQYENTTQTPTAAGPYALGLAPAGTGTGYGASLGGGGAVGTHLKCFEAPGAPVQATLTWPAGTVLPPAVIVKEQSTASWAVDVVGETGSCDCGLPNAVTTSNATSGSSTATRYTVYLNPTNPLVLAGITPAASATEMPNVAESELSASVAYTVTPFPVTLNVPGTTAASSGNLHILIGQQCSANFNFNGLPTGGANQCSVSNIQWSATGNTIQSNSWSVSPGQASATFSGLINPYSYNQGSPSNSAPVWYWDDTPGNKTVTGSALVTPPVGQGDAFTVKATHRVILDAPTFTSHEPPGVVQINANYPPIDNDNPGVYCLWTGPGSNNTPPNGIQFHDTVTTPYVSLYGSAGTWYHLQKLTPSMFRTPPSGPRVGSIYNGQTGLDGSFPYGQTFPADGSFPTPPNIDDDDGPGTALQDPILLPTPSGYKEYNIVNEKFTMYIMYTPPPPPVGYSITVPLANYPWSWNVDVKVPTTPTTSWSNWHNAATGGTITTPADNTAVRVTDFPTWSQIVRASWK